MTEAPATGPVPRRRLLPPQAADRLYGGWGGRKKKERQKLKRVPNLRGICGEVTGRERRSDGDFFKFAPSSLAMIFTAYATEVDTLASYL